MASQGHSPQLLARSTRERFVADVEAVLTGLMETAQGRLIALADLAGSARDQQSRRDLLLDFMRLREAWMQAVRQAWREALASPGVAATRQDEKRSTPLELIGEDEVENSILISRLGTAIAERTVWEFKDLRVRIMSLEGDHDLAVRDVLRPESFATILVDQWMACGLSRPGWTAVQDGLVPMLGDRMLAAYRQANETLIRNGVMPVIEPKAMVRRSAPAGRQTHAQDLPSDGDGTSSGAGSGGFAGGGTGHGGGASRFFGEGTGGHGTGGGQLAGDGAGGHGGGFAGGGAGGHAGGSSRFTGEGAGGYGGGSRFVGEGVLGHGGGGAGGGSTGARGSGRSGDLPEAASLWHGHTRGASVDETRMMTSTTPLARARQRAQGVLGQLKRLLLDRGADFEQTNLETRSPELVQALVQERGSRVQALATGGGHYQGGGVQQMAVEIRARSTELKKKASSASEKATIEVVALMFQAILAEERIPTAIRVWFARLQMPVLRVALDEPEFFGTLQHPARQLIDRMGSCVLGFDASGVQGVAMESEIRRVVQVIEQYPETGRRVFQLVFDEFQKFLSRFLTEKGTTQRVVSVEQQMEQKETLAIQYTIELRKMLNKIRVRDEIREFLFKVWAEALAVAALRHGAQHVDTLALKRTATDLLWAASAKPDREDRARVIQELPKLLQHLRQGMTLLGLPQAAQDAHIKVISDILADAFLSKTEAIAQEEIDDMARRLEQLEVAISDDGTGEIELDRAALEAMLGVDASTFELLANSGASPDGAMLAWVQELELGQWFVLDHNGKVAPVQLVWRSERRQLHLFASAEGNNFLIQARRLAVYLQAGLLAPVEDEALTVRATRQALTKLDANPERLLG